MTRPTGIILDGEAIEAARRKRLMTVGELVEQSGTSGRLVWRARTGQSVSLAKARALAGALRVSLRSLVQADHSAGAAAAGVDEMFDTGPV